MSGAGLARRGIGAVHGHRTLEADLGVGGSESAKRVCIATPDIVGPVKNGGIGTAYHHLARLLAEWGHEVVIAYVNGDAENRALMAKAEALYAELGVAFAPIVPRLDSKYIMAQVAAPTWALLEWLRARERPFDIVHVSEWRGLGYGPLLAKALGLGFAETHFVVKGSSPTLWAAEGNRQLLSTEHDLGWVFMERRSVELADTAICGSAHLLGWMHEAGYALPERSFVWPNVFPAPDPAAAAARGARDGVALAEVVFFGRLEPRKGLVLFIDAMDRLVRQGRAPARVTFLGKPSSIFDGLRHIQHATRGWPVQVRTLTGYGSGEAVAYLSEPGRLAVIPSLLENSSMAVMECLQAGIPFVAAATGGTPELVAPQDRAQALVAAEHIALGERIAELAGERLRAVRPRWDFERSLEVWSRWHGQSAPFEASAERFAQRARAARAEAPLVTVCIVHHERPALVRMAVESVYAQDYPALEAVLVDDGSEGTQARAVLEELEGEFAERGWPVVRQENLHAGAARNAAAAAARGEWLLFLDDDNVLFPDAVTRLVRAARFSGADCVPAASIRFFGDGDPRTDPDSHGTPIRFLGAARAWSRFRNVVGDTCALVRREAFAAVGGYPEEHGLWLQDLCFNNRLIQAGRQVEPMPDPACFYRVDTPSAENRNRSTEAAQVRALAPYLRSLSDEERAFSSFAIGQAEISATERFKSLKVVRMLAELAMNRRYWPLACDLWRELRDRAPEQEAEYVRGAEALLNAGRLDEAEELACEAVTRFPRHPGGYVHSGEAAMRRGDWALAGERWAAVREAFPDHASGWMRGAEACLRVDRVEEAEALAGEAVRRFPDESRGYVLRGEAAMRRGEWALAGERWAALREAFPDHTSGWVRGAEALIGATHLDDAERLADAAMERFPEHPGGYVQRGEAAMRRGEWALAGERWAALREAFPDHASGWVRGAEALLNADRLDEAEAVAGEAAARFPEHPGGYVLRGEAAMRRGEWAAAGTRWAALREAFPDHAPGWVRGAEALLNAGRLDEAEAVAGEAVARFPEHPGGYVLRGEAAMRRGEWAAAGTRWAALREAFPDHAPGWVRGAEALLNAGRLDEAEAVAGEAVARFPEHPGGYVLRGEAAMRRGEWAAAGTRWAALREAFPDKALGYARGAEALIGAGRLDEAEALAGEAVKCFPNRPGGYVQRGEAAMRRGEWAAAGERWAALREAFPNHASGWVRGAEALLNAGRLDEAEAVAGEAVAHFPELPGGYVLRGEAAMRRGEWAAAGERWMALREAFPNHAPGYIRGAQALLNAGRLDEADTVADEAAKRFPNRPVGYMHRAEVAMRRGDWALARGLWPEICRTLADSVPGPVRGMALARRREWFGLDSLEVGILFAVDWAARARRQEDQGALLELRRNGSVVGRVDAKDLAHDSVRMAAGLCTPAHGEALYSLHDALSAEVLAALVAPAWRGSRGVVGAVESQAGAEVRGWVLDGGSVERVRRVAIHVQGSLRAVLDAGGRREDIARWKGTGGRHGFEWSVPEELAGREGVCIEVFDAETGRPLRGSPLRIEGGRAVASAGRGR